MTSPPPLSLVLVDDDVQPTPPEPIDPEKPHGWMAAAACRDQTEKMFPKAYRDISYLSDARKLCRVCPVKAECLNYALQFPASDMHGVWAGHTPRQLAKEQRKRGITPTMPTIAQMLSALLPD